jgi:hypothetical protein
MRVFACSTAFALVCGACVAEPYSSRNYSYYPSYYPTYSGYDPWFWGPSYGLGGSVAFADRHRFHHHHHYHHGFAGRGGARMGGHFGGSGHIGSGGHMGAHTTR